MVEFLFSLRVDAFITSSWTCLVKLGLRLSFIGFIRLSLNVKVDDLLKVIGFFLVEPGFGPVFFE